MQTQEPLSKIKALIQSISQYEDKIEESLEKSFSNRQLSHIALLHDYAEDKPQILNQIRKEFKMLCHKGNEQHLLEYTEFIKNNYSVKSMINKIHQPEEIELMNILAEKYALEKGTQSSFEAKKIKI